MGRDGPFRAVVDRSGSDARRGYSPWKKRKARMIRCSGSNSCARLTEAAAFSESSRLYPKLMRASTIRGSTAGWVATGFRSSLPRSQDNATGEPLANAGDGGELILFTLADDSLQLIRIETRQDSERYLRPDAVYIEQTEKRRQLLLCGEAKERDGIFAQVEICVQINRSAAFAGRLQGR